MATRRHGRAASGVIDVRSQNLSASAGATDFGAYFSYFSFFLMVSALLLAALFFRLSVEQRLPQIGVLRASGFPVAAVRRVLMIEGALVTLVGAGVGVILAIAWARLMVLALTTWWVDAVGTTELSVRVDPLSLAIGAAGAATAGLFSLFLAIRSSEPFVSARSDRGMAAAGVNRIAQTRRRPGCDGPAAQCSDVGRGMDRLDPADRRILRGRLDGAHRRPCHIPRMARPRGDPARRWRR